MINEYSELQVLRAINENTSQPKIAKKIGYSVGKVNFIIKALVQKGLIKIENFSNSKNKSQYRYLLTEEGVKEKIELTKKFIERKKTEYEELQRELEQMNAVYEKEREAN